MNKKIVGIASVSIALLLAVLMFDFTELFENLPIPEMITDDDKLAMSQTFVVEAKYKPSKGVISVYYEDQSKMTDKLIIEIWGLPQTYHKEFECDLGALAKNAKHENVCPDFVSATIKIDSVPEYGWESIPVVFSVEHQKFGLFSIKTEIYETGDPQPSVIFGQLSK